MRTAYSTIIRESMDCTTALFDPIGQLIAQADHFPSHQGTLSHAAKHVLATMSLDPWWSSTILTLAAPTTPTS
jgi:N-methylhydantoinase B/oxoprolinase/acetone carboxylase alpha subunit